MVELVVGLLLAFVTGLTFLAYKHPSAYRQLHDTLVGLLICAGLGALAWNLGVLAAYDALVPFLIRATSSTRPPRQ